MEFVKRHRMIHGCDNMKELIEKKVLSRNWSFNEISDLRNTISLICNDIYSEMSIIEKFKIIDELRIKEDYVGKYFSDVMKEMVYASLQIQIADTIKSLLNTATVNFGGNKNEVSENGLGGESNQERSADEKKENGK
tara:strand:- start:213 stop:623 length:411 start_codon:yes stop_codon:yes gene_type:complete